MRIPIVPRSAKPLVTITPFEAHSLVIHIHVQWMVLFIAFLEESDPVWGRIWSFAVWKSSVTIAQVLVLRTTVSEVIKCSLTSSGECRCWTRTTSNKNSVTSNAHSIAMATVPQQADQHQQAYTPNPHCCVSVYPLRSTFHTLSICLPYVHVYAPFPTNSTSRSSTHSQTNSHGSL